MLACPMCGPFSALNNINYGKMRPEGAKVKLKVAMDRVNFALESCLPQCNAGQLFFFEHPAMPSAWSTVTFFSRCYPCRESSQPSSTSGS